MVEQLKRRAGSVLLSGRARSVVKLESEEGVIVAAAAGNEGEGGGAGGRGALDVVGPFYQSLNDDFECGVCLDHLVSPMITLCSHTACASCIHDWRHSAAEGGLDALRADCPTCRSTVAFPAHPNLHLENMINKWLPQILKEDELASWNERKAAWNLVKKAHARQDARRRPIAPLPDRRQREHNAPPPDEEMVAAANRLRTSNQVRHGAPPPEARPLRLFERRGAAVPPPPRAPPLRLALRCGGQPFQYNSNAFGLQTPANNLAEAAAGGLLAAFNLVDHPAPRQRPVVPYHLPDAEARDMAEFRAMQHQELQRLQERDRRLEALARAEEAEEDRDFVHRLEVARALPPAGVNPERWARILASRRAQLADDDGDDDWLDDVVVPNRPAPRCAAAAHDIPRAQPDPRLAAAVSSNRAGVAVENARDRVDEWRQQAEGAPPRQPAQFEAPPLGRNAEKFAEGLRQAMGESAAAARAQVVEGRAEKRAEEEVREHVRFRLLQEEGEGGVRQAAREGLWFGAPEEALSALQALEAQYGQVMARRQRAIVDGNLLDLYDPLGPRLRDAFLTLVQQANRPQPIQDEVVAAALVVYELLWFEQNAIAPA